MYVYLTQLEIDEEYEDLVEDIRDECSKFGCILSLKVPRPMMGLATPGLGKIFIEYATLDEAKLAKKVLSFIQNLQGKTFDNKTVECTF